MIWLLIIAVLIVMQVGAWVALVCLKNRVELLELRELYRDRGL